MRSLRFQSHLRDLILQGTKTTTWRFFDDKDIQRGDELKFFVNGEEHPFSHAIVTKTEEKKVSELTESEIKGQNYNSIKEVIETHNKYYDGKVAPDTIIKIITFSSTPYILLNPHKISKEEISKLPILKRVRAVVFLDSEKLICLEEDKNGRKMLGLPGGKVEENETNEEAIKREIREETGYIVKELEPIGIIDLVREAYLSHTWCFKVSVQPNPQNTELTESEKIEGIKPIIVSLESAITRSQIQYQETGIEKYERNIFLLTWAQKKSLT